MLIHVQDDKQKLRIDNSIIHQVTIASSSEQVFRSLTNSEIVNLWGGGPSHIEPKLGGTYSLWNGEVHGTIREILPNKHLLHTIYFTEYWDKNWQEALVTWSFIEKTNSTVLILRNSCLPDPKIKDVLDLFWKEQFLGPLKAYLDKLRYLKKYKA